ncbi:MAG: class I SAM-dependent methyltransferase [Clostridia bacterium]
MQLADKWKDYELLDMANGMKLERWGEYIFSRPDPQIVWDEKTNMHLWSKADAIYVRSSSGGGHWEYRNKLKENWKIKYKDLTFNIKPMGFKHTGLFPEQASNWDYMIEKIQKAKASGRKEISVLNLFAYTGGATVACSYAGAKVCHVDSSQGMTAWAKENLASSGLAKNEVRFIVDDVKKFVAREIRRGNKYDAIVMDPPSYGRGKNGEVWNIETDLFELVSMCKEILSEDPLFVLVNSYTGGLSGTVVKNVLKIALDKENLDEISTTEIGIQMKDSDMVLPCGITTKWESK